MVKITFSGATTKRCGLNHPSPVTNAVEVGSPVRGSGSKSIFKCGLSKSSTFYLIIVNLRINVKRIAQKLILSC